VNMMVYSWGISLVGFTGCKLQFFKSCLDWMLSSSENPKPACI
jgi:hypothetical protein